MFKSRPENILLYGGSRSGKTSLAIAVIILTALKYPGIRQLVCRKHLSDLVPSVIEDTYPKICRLLNPELRESISLNRKYMFARFPNESEIWFCGMSNADSAEKALGNEYARIYANEATQLPFSIYEKLKTRLAQNIPGFSNQFVLDCNPTHTAHWLHDLFVKKIHPIDKTAVDKKNNVYVVMNPKDNESNLPKGYIDRTLKTLSSQQRKRFLEGLWQHEIEGALWKQSYLNRAEMPSDFDKIVISIDPAITSKSTSDETGIIVAGRKNDKAYVLADRSGRYTPNQWAQLVVKLYKDYEADTIICETNQGGDIVKQNIRNVMKNIPIVDVRAYRGKDLRAYPIVALYEQKKVFHCGVLNELEDQMIGWTPNDKSFSPDRMDALVYAMVDLMLNKKQLLVIRV